MAVVSEIRQHNSGKFYRDDFRGDKSWNGNEHNVLLRGECAEDGSPKFADVGMALGADDITDARGVAIADFDNDGDLDLAINTQAGDHGVESVPPVLLRNDVGQQRNWLAVRLTGKTSNRDAIGAQVTVKTKEADSSTRIRLRHVTAGGGYASQNSDRLYFGLGDADQVESLFVRWPSGETQTFENISANRLIELTEGGELETTRMIEITRFSRSTTNVKARLTRN